MLGIEDDSFIDSGSVCYSKTCIVAVFCTNITLSIVMNYSKCFDQNCNRFFFRSFKYVKDLKLFMHGSSFTARKALPLKGHFKINELMDFKFVARAR